jgi:zinc transport system substrate-binding protein
LTLAEGIELIRAKDEISGEHVHKGGTDPHIWMSPKTVKTFLPKLKDGIIKSFPEHKELIEKNYSGLYHEVTKLHNEFTALTNTLSQKKFMIFHPALSYLARDYGLEQISIEHEGKEPSPRQLKELIDLANKENIRLIFIQAEFDQRNAQMVKDATGAALVVINPLAYDWVENLYSIKQHLEKHLT